MPDEQLTLVRRGFFASLTTAQVICLVIGSVVVVPGMVLGVFYFLMWKSAPRRLTLDVQTQDVTLQRGDATQSVPAARCIVTVYTRHTLAGATVARNFSLLAPTREDQEIVIGTLTDKHCKRIVVQGATYGEQEIAAFHEALLQTGCRVMNNQREIIV